MGGDLQFPPDPPPEPTDETPSQEELRKTNEGLTEELKATRDPTPPTRTSGRMRAVSSAPPTAGVDESDMTTAEAGCDECGLVNDHEADCETGATTKHAAQVKH